LKDQEIKKNPEINHQTFATHQTKIAKHQKNIRENVHVKWQLPKKEITSVAAPGATWNTGALSGVAGEVL